MDKNIPIQIYKHIKNNIIIAIEKFTLEEYIGFLNHTLLENNLNIIVSILYNAELKFLIRELSFDKSLTLDKALENINQIIDYEEKTLD